MLHWIPLSPKLFSLALSWQALTGQVDAYQIKLHADSIHLPHEVALTITWNESRSGRLVNAYRGPGRWKTDTTVTLEDDTVITKHRICREIGRLQLNPCQRGWAQGPRCTVARVTASYDDNVYCGLRYAQLLQVRCGDYTCAVRSYNGGGPLADRYLTQSAEYLGRLRLRVLSQ